MKIHFKRTFEKSKFLDPFNDFNEKMVSIEIREDPITAFISRILKFRFKLPESKKMKNTFKDSNKGCPFCPENVDRMTPKFTTDFLKVGRMNYGKCIILPNIFPYSKYNSVVVLSNEHFISVDEFTMQELTNGFIAAQKYIRLVLDFDSNVRHCSINWNYMPSAGAGLIHPHLQVVVDESPTWMQGVLFERSKKYYEENSSTIWKDLLVHEKKSNLRYIGTIGPVSFISAFAPTGMMGEVIAIFEGKSFLTDLSEGDLSNFSEGLTRIFRYFGRKNISSFNLCLYSGLISQSHFWVNSRIIPRFTIPPLNISDINYVEKLHKEAVSTVLPEEMCKEIREFM